MPANDDDYENFEYDEDVPDNYCPFHPGADCKPEDHFGDR